MISWQIAIMVSGGIGITPMMSMLSHFCHLHATGDASVNQLEQVSQQ